jgi:peptide-methionine (S)-S-oxide reductase
MSKSSLHFALFLIVLLGTVGCTAGNASTLTVPAPLADVSRAGAPGQQTAVIAGGCFWGIQAVFQHVKGVINATSGYSGGEAKTADYETVSTGETGHAESVKITYDPSQITYGQLLRIFFSVAHDPTELNRQGPDDGTQYRSVIFYGSDEQKKIAEAYIAQLDKAKIFSRPIVKGVFSGGSLSSELCNAAPEPALYRLQRRAESGAPPTGVSGFLRREVGKSADFLGAEARTMTQPVQEFAYVRLGA